jgi:UDP:flavonoid glycosyltransferase YjiC (YdhE family)
MAALGAGLPLVVIPISADQPHNARRCAALGVGKVIEPAAATPAAIRDAARAVLADPRYRRAAERYRAEAVGLPPLARGVELLERLVAGRSATPAI